MGRGACISSVPWDWRDESGWWPATPDWKPGSFIGVISIAQFVLEALEFCRRLTDVVAVDDAVHIELTLVNIEGRKLFPDSTNRVLAPYYQASVNQAIVKYDKSSAALIGTLDAMTADAVRRIYDVFGLKVAPQVLESIIAEARGR
jgi:hypothetical protein